tara:strand:+ start:173 stop:481 length:309 start_codon:yes stop_codon:yes gene_type:complete
MSYVTLTNQYKDTLVRKYINYVKQELKETSIEFDSMFFVDVPIDDDSERWICRGITSEGLLTGRDTIGNDVDFEITGLDIDTMSYIMDQLMEVNYSVLQLEL